MRTKVALAFAFGFAIATFELGVHVFLWLVPAMAMTLVLASEFFRRHKRIIALVAFAIGTFVIMLLLLVPSTLRFTTDWLAWSDAKGFLTFVHSPNEPTAYTGLYASIAANWGLTPSVVIGILLLLPAMLGIFIVLYPLGLAVCGWRGRLNAMDLVPPLLVLMFILFVIFMPAPPHLGPVFKYRGVMFVYQVIAIWTAVYITRSIFNEPAVRNSLPVAFGLGALVVLALVVGLNTGADPAAPKFAWGKIYIGRVSSRG